MSIIPLRTPRAAQSEPIGDLVVRHLRRVATLLLTWHERARQRRHLESLSDRMLRDIGLTRADVLAESSKPFWRL